MPRQGRPWLRSGRAKPPVGITLQPEGWPGVDSVSNSSTRRSSPSDLMSSGVPEATEYEPLGLDDDQIDGDQGDHHQPKHQQPNHQQPNRHQHESDHNPANHCQGADNFQQLWVRWRWLPSRQDERQPSISRAVLVLCVLALFAYNVPWASLRVQTARIMGCCETGWEPIIACDARDEALCVAQASILRSVEGFMKAPVHDSGRHLLKGGDREPLKTAAQACHEITAIYGDIYAPDSEFIISRWPGWTPKEGKATAAWPEPGADLPEGDNLDITQLCQRLERSLAYASSHVFQRLAVGLDTQYECFGTADHDFLSEGMEPTLSNSWIHCTPIDIGQTEARALSLYPMHEEGIDAARSDVAILLDMYERMDRVMTSLPPFPPSSWASASSFSQSLKHIYGVFDGSMVFPPGEWYEGCNDYERHIQCKARLVRYGALEGLAGSIL